MLDPVKHYNTILPLPDMSRYQRIRTPRSRGLCPLIEATRARGKAIYWQNIDSEMAREHPIRPRSPENLRAMRDRRPAPHPAFAGRVVELTVAVPSNAPPVFRNLFNELLAADSIDLTHEVARPAVIEPQQPSGFTFRPAPQLIFNHSRLHALNELSILEEASLIRRASVIGDLSSDSESEEENVNLTNINLRNTRKRALGEDLNPTVKRSRQHRSPSSSPTF